MTTYGNFSSYQVERWLGQLTNHYAALHYDNPEVAGAYASEVFGGSYIRCKVIFTVPDNRAVWNANNLSWAGLPSMRISYIALWDAQINGNYVCSAPLDSVFRAVAGAKFIYPAGSFAISFAGAMDIIAS